MRLLKVLAAALISGGMSIPAFGADFNAPVVDAAGIPSWAGPYLGLQIGYGNSRATGTTFDGILGGAQFGYNVNVARNVILGVEADIAGADFKASETATLFGVPAIATVRTHVFGTARGRLGYTLGRFLFYGTGGFAWAVNEVTGTVGGVTSSDTRSHAGYVFGAGVEWMITPVWTARAEYLYAHFGSRGYFGGIAPSGTVDTSLLRVGVNYLFH